MLLENDLLFTFGAYLSIVTSDKPQLVSVLIVSDQDLVTDFHIVKERIDLRINSIKPVSSIIELIAFTDTLDAGTWLASGEWWSQGGSNSRPPACKAGALPAELWPRKQSKD